MRIRTLCVVAGSLLLSGCGGPPPTDRSGVATLQTETASPAPSSPADARERPLRRPDDGPEVFDRYVRIYNQCLVDKGATTDKGSKPRIGSDAKSKAAAAECWHLYPENWQEREQRTNPEYADLLRTEAECLKAKGHHVTVGGDPVSIMYGDNTSANKAYDDERECERQAFRESVEKYNAGGS
jgi:hypothetical protein